MPRLLLSCMLSVCVVFALFFIMQKIIFQERMQNTPKMTYKGVDFIKLKPKEKKSEKKQKEKPKEKKRVLPKRVQVAKTQKIQRENIKVDIPKLDLPLEFKQTANLNDITIEQQLQKTKVQPLVYSSDIAPIFATPPQYPRRAKRRNIQGYVIVFFTISKKGDVKNISIKEAKPKGFFEEAAINAIKQWKFNPKMLEGTPIEQLAQQRLEFKLR